MSEKTRPIEIDSAFIINAMANRWNSEQEKAIRNEFKTDDESTFAYSDHQHHVLSKKALKLAKRVVARGGTDDEVERILKYLHVCINMVKYRLDLRKAYDTFGIGELNDKYMLGRKMTESKPE